MILSHAKSSNVMEFASTIAGMTVWLIHLLGPQELCQHSLITSLAHRQCQFFAISPTDYYLDSVGRLSEQGLRGYAGSYTPA